VVDKDDVKVLADTVLSSVEVPTDSGTVDTDVLVSRSLVPLVMELLFCGG
jgi:hypothetical protein